jgi:glutamine amidotransferase/cyclase
MSPKKKDLVVSILDYGAGNVRSVRNAIGALGYEIRDIASAEQIRDAAVVVFPGVGAFGSAVSVLEEGGYGDALASYLREDRPFLGICLGMQTLFESSEESWESDEAAAQEEGEQTQESSKRIPGLGIIPGCVVKFDPKLAKVPHIGWNGRTLHQSSPVFKYAGGGGGDEHLYFVHSYCAPVTPENAPWVLSSTWYGGRRFVSSVQRGNVVATQFHPEKSGPAGLRFLRGFLEVRKRTRETEKKPRPS